MRQLAAKGESFLYEQVTELVRKMIDDGTLTAGDRIPSLRRMSKQLKVSIATVMQAYLELERQGLLESKPQSGFFVKRPARTAIQLPRCSNPTAAPRQVRVNDTVEAFFEAARNPETVPLGIANPAPCLLPVKGLTRALAQVTTQQKEAAVSYQFLPGNKELRRQIAFRTIDLGCDISPDDVLITNGTTEALAISLKAVAKPGDMVAVESPAYFSILRLIELLDILAVEIPSNPETGMSLEALQEAMQSHDIKAVILVANYSNPTGSLMPEPNKIRLVELLAEHKVPLIEDDSYGELSFDGSRPRIAKCFDKTGLVLSCSSFSKTLAPGYRVGWVIPGRYMRSVTDIKRMFSSETAAITQQAVAEFLRSGHYERHLRRMRKAFKEQVEHIRYLVCEHFPENTRITNPQGGFVLWLELPRGVDSMALFAEAMQRSISITPGPLFSPTHKFKNFIRLSCGHPHSHAIDEAIITLGELVHQAAGSTVTAPRLVSHG